MQKTLFFLGAMLICFPNIIWASAAEELQKAKFEERTHSEAAAFQAAIDGLRKFPHDKNLFLYALDFSHEASSSQLNSLAETSEAMLKRYPKDYSWNLSACMLMRIKGKAEDGLQNCLLALQYGKKEFKANLELAKTYLEMGIYDRAEEFAGNATEIDPINFSAAYTTGEIYEAQSLFLKAKKAYTASLALAGENISAHGDANAAKAAAAIKRVSNMQKMKKARDYYTKSKADKNTLLSNCLKKFHDFISKENFVSAVKAGRNCAKISPRNFNLAVEIAEALVNAGEYESAIDEYERALTLAGNQRLLYAQACIKEAEILIRLNDINGTEKKYRMAAESAPFDEKTLITVADYFLGQAKQREALHYFSLVLEIAPQNTYARANAEKLQLDLMSDEDILAELKQRGAISSRAKVLNEENLRLHRNMRLAEAAGAIEIIRSKFPGKHGLYYEDSANGLKIKLTMEGYKAYARAISRDAVSYFERKGINLREIFKLRDKNGDAFFDKSGQITPEGINAWLETSETGRPTWIFSYQPVPNSKQQVKASRALAKLSRQGYKEISEPEYLWLLKATNCPAHILKESPINLTEVDDGAMVHYMLCYTGQCLNSNNKALPFYIERYRNGDTSISTGKSSGFFGTGAVKQYRFCENGRLWLSETSSVPVPS